ncbi:hypothetical protein AMTRI_Chr11g95320 [Amborella trichopoda]
MTFGSVSSAFALEYLNLSRNQHSGPVMYSDDIPLFNSLNVLDLSHNHLSGELSGFRFVYALEVLNLGSNRFSGSLPNELLRQGSLFLTDLDLSANNLSGNKIGNCTIVDLSRNRFTGSLSVITASNDNVEVLDLSCNQLFGPIPLDASSFLRLHYLNISFNSLEGPIASIIPLYPKLRALYLSSNHFNGSLPTNLLASPTVKKLFELDLSSNQLDGSIPREFGFMGDLTRLVISRKHFSVFFALNWLTDSLNYFNASYNDFSGSVPSNLMKFPESSFYLGNSKLLFPCQTPSSYEATPIVVGVKVAVTLGCAVGVSMLLLLPLFHRKRASYTSDCSNIGNFSNIYPSNGPFAEDPAIGFKSQVTEVDIPMGVSPPRASEEENHGAFGDFSPNWLPGDLVCLDKTMFLTNEELSRAPAEVLGRSIHGTSYRAILDEGNIRHMNVVPIRGYYWGPGLHEKLLFLDYVCPGSLANYLFGKWTLFFLFCFDSRGASCALPHGNICASNILLDSPEFLAHFELCPPPAHIDIHPPLEISSKEKPKPSFKGDTDAFGLVLIALLTGKDTSEFIKPGSLMDWVRRLMEEEHGDLVDVGEEECVAMKRVLAIAMRCALPANVRPSIKVVYKEISFCQICRVGVCFSWSFLLSFIVMFAWPLLQLFLLKAWKLLGTWLKVGSSCSHIHIHVYTHSRLKPLL